MAAVRFYPKEIDRLLYQPGGPVGTYIRKLAKEVAAEAATLARKELGKHPDDQPRTGRYAGNFKVEVEYPIPRSQGGFRFKVVNRTRGQNPRRTQSYAAVIERGARAHTIWPRKPKKFLVYYVGGRKVVTPVVRWQPGRQQISTSGAHILSRSLKKVVLRNTQ